MYRPPSSSVSEFNIKLSNILSKLNSYNQILLVGDFNIDIGNPASNTEITRFIDTMKTKLFMPLINSPTRITLTSGSTIDHIWSDDVNQVNESFSGILTSKITDHFTVLTKLKINYNRQEGVLKTFRDHSERVLSNFSYELQNFLPHFQEQYYLDLHHKVESLCSNLYNIYDRNCPIRKNNISNHGLLNLLNMGNTKHEMRDLANMGVI